MRTRSRCRWLSVAVAACICWAGAPAAATEAHGYGRVTSALINIGDPTIMELELPSEGIEHSCEEEEQVVVEVDLPKAPVGTGNQDNIEVTYVSVVTLFKDFFVPPPVPPAPDNRDWYQLRIELTDPMDAIYDQMGDLNETTGPKPLEIDNLELDLYFEIWSMPNIKDEEAEEPCEKGDLVCFGWVGFPALQGGYHPDDYPTDILPGHAWIEGESDEDGIISSDCSQPWTQFTQELVEVKNLQICFKDSVWAPTDPDCTKS